MSPTNCCTKSTPIQADLLLAASSGEGTTVVHALCTGEPLGPLGGCLLWALRTPAGGVWPSRHQRARQELLCQLVQRHPGLLLQVASRDAAGGTPLHRAVLSQSLGPLALLLAALQQLQLCQQLLHPAGAASAASPLHLLLSVPNSQGLSAFELAVSRQQWAAARLLASAARGEPPLSQAQLEASELVRRCVAAACSGGRSGRGAISAGAAGGLQLSASGPTVAEALGGLLSKMWDAIGASAAAVESDEGGLSIGGKQAPLLGEAGAAAGGTESGPDVRAMLQEVLQPEALDLAAVLTLMSQEEQRGLAAAKAEAEQAAGGTAAAVPVAVGSGSRESLAGGAASSPTTSPPPAPDASSSAAALRTCIVCYDELPPGWLTVRLRCGHSTCDACWRGILLAAIDEGELLPGWGSSEKTVALPQPAPYPPPCACPFTVGCWLRPTPGSCSSQPAPAGSQETPVVPSAPSRAVRCHCLQRQRPAWSQPPAWAGSSSCARSGT